MSVTAILALICLAGAYRPCIHRRTQVSPSIRCLLSHGWVLRCGFITYQVPGNSIYTTCSSCLLRFSRSSSADSAFSHLGRRNNEFTFRRGESLSFSLLYCSIYDSWWKFRHAARKDVPVVTLKTLFPRNDITTTRSTTHPLSTVPVRNLDPAIRGYNGCLATRSMRGAAGAPRSCMCLYQPSTTQTIANKYVNKGTLNDCNTNQQRTGYENSDATTTEQQQCGFGSMLTAVYAYHNVCAFFVLGGSLHHCRRDEYVNRRFGLGFTCIGHDASGPSVSLESMRSTIIITMLAFRQFQCVGLV